MLSVPDTKGRYYLMPMLDAWTNVFASPGKRTTGTKAGQFAIAGPGWKGTLPGGVNELSRRPTWCGSSAARRPTAGGLRGRARDPGRYKLVPLSAFGKPYTPPEGRSIRVDMKTAPVEQVEGDERGDVLQPAGRAHEDEPAACRRRADPREAAKIGIVPGEKFDRVKARPRRRKGPSSRAQAAWRS